MKKILFILNVLFIILTFMGIGYVLYNNGHINAGYAVVPMTISIILTLKYQSIRNKN